MHEYRSPQPTEHAGTSRKEAHLSHQPKKLSFNPHSRPTNHFPVVPELYRSAQLQKIATISTSPSAPHSRKWPKSPSGRTLDSDKISQYGQAADDENRKVKEEEL